MMQLTETFLAQEKDLKTIKKILDKTIISAEDEKTLLIALGFKSYSEALELSERIKYYNLQLDKDFDFSQMNDRDKHELVLKSVSIYRMDDLHENRKSCSSAYNACMDHEFANFNLASVGCMGTGMGLGILNPFVGGGFILVCIAEAGHSWGTAQDVCFQTHIINCRE